MSGVEILAAEEVVAESTFNVELACLCWLVVIIVCGIFGYFSEDKDKVYAAFLGCVVGAILGIFVFGGIAACTTEVVAYETHYKVAISDEVFMNEFLDKYEILDQDGKIYTVRERE